MNRLQWIRVRRMWVAMGEHHPTWKSERGDVRRYLMRKLIDRVAVLRPSVSSMVSCRV